MFSSWWSEWLAATPDVKAAVIGNVGIVAVAILSLIGTGWFASRQLRHDRQEKAKDRALELKKGLLIDAIRGAQEMVSAIVSAADIDKPHTESTAAYLAGSQKLTAGAAVAGISTVSRGRDFADAAGPAFMRILGQRAPASFKKQKIDMNHKLISEQLGDNRRFVELMREALTSGNSEGAKAHAELYEVGEQIHGELLDKNARLYDDLNPLRKALGFAATSEAKNLSQPFNLFVAAVRKDVGIDDSDSSAFLNAVRVDLSKLDQTFQALTEELEEAAKRD